MDPNADHLIELFHQAKTRPAGAERDRFLLEACRGEPQLKEQVLSLLLAHDEAGDFLQCPQPPLPSGPDMEKPGDRIGHYKLIEPIGEGGYGVVYLAEQEEPVRRRVALKVIKLGMDTKAVVARFEAERQALALMDHPNIARVLEAGATATGRPFFVMELVQGARITHYCEVRHLPVEQRLRLFIQVCQGVQHAHQKGIIHRDLKPSNVLVAHHDPASAAVPKVIDFGIAKATSDQPLTDKTVFTAFDQFIGTPAYMSPEQAGTGGLDIDTRSDIYSLGVLLYELLTGSTPFDTRELTQAGLDKMRKIIREREPLRPSTRLTQLPKSQIQNPKSKIESDLDWIVMKCLEKDRGRRYSTANGLAADLERLLNREPVVARPPSTAYRVRKAFRRNKLVFAAAAAVAASLVIGLAVSVWRTLEAVRAREEANRLRLQTEKHLYAADMLLAYEAHARGHLGRTRELLAKYSADPRNEAPLPQDLRCWEWRHLWSRTRGDDSTVLLGHTNEVSAVLFLDDGRTLFSASRDGTLRFWDIESGATPAILHYPYKPRRPSLSPNGEMIAVDGAEGHWCVLDARNHRLLHSATHDHPVLGTAFSPDNRFLAVAAIDLIRIVDLSTWQTVTRISKSDPAASDRFLAPVAFSPAGDLLAYSHADRRIILRELETGAEITVGRSARGEALTLCFTRDGRFLISGDRERISVWELARPGVVNHLTEHHEQVVCVALSPDGGLLASASGDQTIKLWNTATWEATTLRGHEHEVHGVAFSPDGKRLASSGKDETIRLWAVPGRATRADRFPLARGGPVMPQHPTAGRIIDFDWNARRATSIDVAASHSYSNPLPPTFRRDTLLAVSPDASTAALALDDGSVELWQTDPFHPLRVLPGSRSPAVAAALAHDPHRLAVVRADGTTELWRLDPDPVHEQLPALSAPVTVPVRGTFYPAVSFWVGGKLLVRVARETHASPDLIDLFDIDRREHLLIQSSHKGHLNNLTLSNDGTLLATTAWDGTLRLWNLSTGRELEPLRGQLVSFTSAAFSPDDTRLVAGGYDGSVTIWDMASRQQVASWRATRRHCFVGFMDGGRILLTAGEAVHEGGFELALWRAPTFDEIAAGEAMARTKERRD